MDVKRINENGFTLIEVVIALGILGFGILTMFSMQAFGIRGNRIANTITQEVSIGVNALELAYGKQYEDKKLKTTKNTLQDQTHMATILKNAVDTSNYTITYKAPLMDEPATGLMTLEVEMTSNVDNRKVNFQFVRVNMDGL